MNRTIYVIVAVAMMLIGGAIGHMFMDSSVVSRLSGDAKSAGEGDPLPRFFLRDLDDNLYTITEWKNQALIINFWASWCSPCRREMPVFAQIAKEYADRDVTVLGIAVEQAHSARAFAQSMNIDYPLFYAYEDGATLYKLLGNRKGAIPYTVLVDKEGIIRHTFFGEIQEEKLRDLLTIIM